MRKPGQFDCDAERRRHRREQQDWPGVDDRHSPAAATTTQASRAPSAPDTYEPGASGTHGQLHAREMKRSSGR